MRPNLLGTLSCYRWFLRRLLAIKLQLFEMRLLRRLLHLELSAILNLVPSGKLLQELLFIWFDVGLTDALRLARSFDVILMTICRCRCRLHSSVLPFLQSFFHG